MTETETPADTIKRLRLGRGWSLAELAREAERDASYLGRIESGKRRPSKHFYRHLMAVLNHQSHPSPTPGDG